MLEKNILEKMFNLNPPIDENSINNIQKDIDIIIPNEYKEFLLICNGLNFNGNLALHELEDMPQRNLDYGVQESLPDYFMIGDDSGGRAILINKGGVIFEVGMGDMSLEGLEKSAESIEDLLINHEGKTLNERNFD